MLRNPSYNYCQKLLALPLIGEFDGNDDEISALNLYTQQLFANKLGYYAEI